MTETLRVGYIGINFVSSSFSVPSQFLHSYFPKLIRAKVHDGNSEGRLHWYKMSFLKSILKQNAVYQSNFQMSRQCLQRSDVFYLTLQRFTVSTYIGDGLQSEDFQTFSCVTNICSLCVDGWDKNHEPGNFTIFLAGLKKNSFLIQFKNIIVVI